MSAKARQDSIGRRKRMQAQLFFACVVGGVEESDPLMEDCAGRSR
jgi:hypothetical protein